MPHSKLKHTKKPHQGCAVVEGGARREAQCAGRGAEWGTWRGWSALGPVTGADARLSQHERYACQHHNINLP